MSSDFDTYPYTNSLNPLVVVYDPFTEKLCWQHLSATIGLSIQTENTRHKVNTPKVTRDAFSLVTGMKVKYGKS